LPGNGLSCFKKETKKYSVARMKLA